MKLPNVSSKYGAPMGRNGYSTDQFLACYEGLDCRVSLARVPLDMGGYDSGGAYWGSGCDIAPLWLASFTDSDGETVESFFRASDRNAAKVLLSGCRFYR